MAVINPTLITVGRKDGSCFLVSWLAVTEADTCGPMDFPDLADKTVHVAGTFGGASVAIFGANNNFATAGAALRGPDSVAIAITAETVKQILENPKQIKPVPTGGTAQSLNIYILAKQSQPLRT